MAGAKYCSNTRQVLRKNCMLSPRALILRGPGTNCDQETAYAFERAGGHTKRIHVQALAQSPSLLDDFQIFCIPGGFSYGDDIASGRILALELTERLGDTLRRFHERGGLIIGICNGFQVLLQTGLLTPDSTSGKQAATLTRNASEGSLIAGYDYRPPQGTVSFFVVWTTLNYLLPMPRDASPLLTKHSSNNSTHVANLYFTMPRTEMGSRPTQMDPSKT